MRELSYAGFGVFTMKLYNLYTKIDSRSYQNTNRPNDKGTYILHDREIDSKMSLVELVVIKALL